MRHIVSYDDLSSSELKKVFTAALKFKKKKTSPPLLRNKILASVFYEPSTRTRFSFETAVQRLGGRVLSTENAAEFSSAAKGETLQDTIRVISKYADLIVLRHPQNGAAEIAAQVATVPLINAGDGSNEHPTQAFLDLFTIWEATKNRRLPRQGLRIVFLGDNSRSRTVRSLVLLLVLRAKALGLSVSSFAFGGNGKSSLPTPELMAAIKKAGIKIEKLYDLKNADILYSTRIQKERYHGTRHAKPFVLSLKEAATLPRHAIIMHPLPRTGELLPEVDADPRAWYFTQVENGIYVRMALLTLLLKPSRRS